MVPPTPKRMMWRVTEAPWKMLQRSLCCSFAAFSWFWGLVSSQYLISTRWMSRRVLLRSLGRCCLGLVALLVAGGAAEVLPVPLNCPPPLRRTHPPTLFCCFCVVAAMGVTSTKFGPRPLGKPIFVWEAGWKKPLWYNPSWIWRFCIASHLLLPIYPCRQSRILWSRSCWWLWRSCCMLSCISQCSDHISYLRVLASKKDMQGTV